MKFLRADDSFDVDRFIKAVELIITAMDISIVFADFPTESITQTTRDYRQLGIGYANLGALLMALGKGYDFPEGGRSLAAAITSLMTAAAYRRSAELAGVVGTYAGYGRNADAHKRVMRKHRSANDSLRTINPIDAGLREAAASQWDQVIEVGERNGFRNLTGVPAGSDPGTIGFMMDCDTTGIEPDFSLVKFKKLVVGLDADRQPHGAEGVAQPGLPRRADRGHRGLHQRQGQCHRCSGSSRNTMRSSTRPWVFAPSSRWVMCG